MLNITEITPNISYVGVNDRTTVRFEGLWPLPFGVSYNSYLVRGSHHVALIDSVEIGTLPELLANLSRNGVDRIDYLVVNHMEPDHSGAIPELARAFPEMRIVGNRNTVGMVGGYYGLSDPGRFITVADGDTLDLGDISLQFHLTPMVHWPETMMTYVPERRVIFTGDAFGTFGALDGGVIDTEMDTGRYIPEMYRYYSNIVGKYGRFVQRAMAKTAGLVSDYICPTHGPVWHERRAEVVGIYDRLSRYEGERGVTIVYGSMYGHTAAMAEEMARCLAARGILKIRVHNATFSEMSDIIADAFRYTGLVVASPTYSGHLFPPIEQFMTAIETRELKNRVFATMGSHTWAPATKAGFSAYAERLGIESLGHIEMKQNGDNSTSEEIAALADRIAASL